MSTDEAFPLHVFDALGVDPIMHGEPIAGVVRVIEKHPADAPITVITLGASRLATDSGERVELAVEVIEGQEGAARVALEIVCDDILKNRRVPPVGAPWRNSEPFLTGTRISALMVTPSRWGASFDEIRSADGDLLGHVRTLRLLTDAEAGFAAANGWEALVAAAGSIEALLDVEREDSVEGGGLPGNAPAFVSKLHAEHPPRWVTFTGNSLESVTGLESDEYMNDSANLEVWSVDSFVKRFPFVADFVRQARAGQTAMFVDASGEYVLEGE